jgi:hypothetical protein
MLADGMGRATTPAWRLGRHPGRKAQVAAVPRWGMPRSDQIGREDCFRVEPVSHANLPPRDFNRGRISRGLSRRSARRWGNYGEYARLRANNDAQVAMTQCESNPSSAIPVLERELRNNRFTLPAPPVGA